MRLSTSIRRKAFRTFECLFYFYKTYTKYIENKVYSFDYVAVNKDVTACDIAHAPLDDESLDAAIFSLSLMGNRHPNLKNGLG